MPFNVPTIDTTRYSFGPAVLFIGAVGTTPQTEIGSVRESVFNVTRERLDVFQGSPRTMVKTFIIQEGASIQCSGIEWNIDRLADVLGAGITSSTATEDILSFGGSLSLQQKALRLQHVTPAGHTVNIYFWIAEGVGELEITFGDDLQEFPFTFEARRATSTWAGAALPETQQLFRIVRQKA